jgi:mannose-1-phosphate guanylyltransferase
MSTTTDETKKHTYCVIMAGGIGSRFWPMSRTAYPKQFLDFLGLGRTLIQQTFDRFMALCPPENILVVTNAQYAPIVRQQLPQLKAEQILQEPSRRNTAPCVAYANHVIQKRDPQARIIVAPSDHLVMKEADFHNTVRLAILQAESSDCLVTLGIKPSRPDTGYGYIQCIEGTGTVSPEVKRVASFREKPDHATAVKFLESGDFLWNSGIFIWSLTSIRNAFRQHLPAMEAQFEAGAAAFGTPDERSFITELYKQCESISIDYGVMEKAKNVFVVPSDFGWSDLGTWGSLYTHVPKDASGNATVGAHVRLHDCANNMVHVHDDRLVVLQGLNDMIVVSTKDALLVVRKHDEQKIKQFVEQAAKEWGEKYV